MIKKLMSRSCCELKPQQQERQIDLSPLRPTPYFLP